MSTLFLQKSRLSLCASSSFMRRAQRLVLLLLILLTTSLAQAQNGLRGDYFSDTNFTNLVHTQVDKTVDAAYRENVLPRKLNTTPMTGVGPENYSVRWTGYLKAMESGTYSITMYANDGAKVWLGDLNGAPIIIQNNFISSPSGVNFTMVAGQQYPIKIEYFQNNARAEWQLRWKRPSGTVSATIPQSQLNPTLGTGTGLKGQYFSDAAFTNLVKTQTDPTLNLDWGNGSPTSGVGSDNFSVRWSGQIEAVETGTYTLAVTGDETAKVWVQNLSGAPLINHSSPNGGNPTSNTFAMQAGQFYDIKVDYTESTGSANMKLFWTRPGGSSVIVPQIYLHSVATIFPATTNAMRLPIEVMGAEGTQVSLNLSLNASQASSANRLWLQTHNLRYAEKASFQINGGGWISLNNSTATMLGNSGVYGGIGGSFAVLKMTLPITPGQLVAGNNTINFRFNVSNGLAVGYRIVNLNLLDASGNRLIADSAFTQENPANWQPPSSAQADIAAGENLWRNANLISSYKPGATPLNAKCASCHMQDGRDLKYFSYSNHTIIERAKFHGLSQAQGAQIASYIRTRPVNSPGRPWNPPYQPGPGTSSRLNNEWLAGAGIENVVENDADTLQSIFPNGVRRDALMEGDTNKFKRFSSHDTSLAFQLPDWNHWLPEIHPVDAFPIYFAASKSLNVYNNLRTQLVGKTPTQVSEWMRNSNPNPATGYFLLNNFYGDANNEFADQMYADIKYEGGHRNAEVARQIYSFGLWKMVKHAEIHEEFALTGLGKVANQIAWAGYESRDALPRMWMGANRSVFDSSPFLSGLEYPISGSTSGNNGFNYSYISNSWYQLQLILNGGQRTMSDHQAVDFGYAFQFTSGFEKDTAFTQMGRHFVWCLKGMDEGDNDRGPNHPSGWSFNRATLNPLYPYIAPESSNNVPVASAFSRDAMALLLQVWLEKNNSWLPEQIFSFPNGTPKSGNEDGFDFNRTDWVIGSGNDEAQSRSIPQNIFSLMTRIKAQNILPAALQNGYAQWSQVMWPGLDSGGNSRNNWMQFTVSRVGSAPTAPTLALASTYGDIRVSWTNAPGITSYNVKRSTSAAGPFLTVAYFRTSGEYTDSVPLQDREYYYKLSANTAAGESPDSTATLSNILANRLMGTVIGTAPSNDDKIREATDGDRHTIAFAYTNGAWTGFDLGTARSVTRIGYVPQRAYSNRMIGGKFQASNSANFSSGVVDLHTITTDPGDGYEEKVISVSGTYRYVRYLLPRGNGGNGEFAEMTFWENTGTVTQPSINSSLSASGTVGIAISNYTITASNSPTSYGATGLPAGLNINTSTGVISGTPTSAGTSNVTLNATNSGGTGTATLVITIAPAGGGGNPVLLSGTIVGTNGSWGGGGNTKEKAMDGDTNSYFDAASANGNWVGLDLGTAQVISQVRYFPRSDQAGRMDGGLFQGSNTADFSSGVTTLHTITGTPPVAFTTVAINNGSSFRYVRYLAPDDSFGNVAELEFYTGTTSTALAGFRTAHGLAANGSQDALTPAGDGTANLLKFAFNMIGGSVGQASSLSSPNAATLLANGSAGLPRVSTDGTGKLQLTHIRRKAATNSGITTTVEFSSTLAAGSWAVNDAASTSVSSIDPTFERVTVTDSSAAGKRFARVRITTLN